MLCTFRPIERSWTLSRSLCSSNVLSGTNKEWKAMQRRIKAKADRDWKLRENSDHFQTNVGNSSMTRVNRLRLHALCYQTCRPVPKIGWLRHAEPGRAFVRLQALGFGLRSGFLNFASNLSSFRNALLILVLWLSYR